jgi:hypothetical protein
MTGEITRNVGAIVEDPRDGLRQGARFVEGLDGLLRLDAKTADQRAEGVTLFPETEQGNPVVVSAGGTPPNGCGLIRHREETVGEVKRPHLAEWRARGW